MYCEKERGEEEGEGKKSEWEQEPERGKIRCLILDLNRLEFRLDPSLYLHF
jgi:hypothetical protein